MKIKFIKIKNKFYQADCEDCPGAPPVGYGKTKEAALAALFYCLMFDNAGGQNDPHNWLCYIKQDEPITINNKLWKNPWK